MFSGEAFPFYSSLLSESEIASPSFLWGPGFFHLAFHTFPVSLVSGLSPSLGHQGPADGPGHAVCAALTASGFLLSVWEALLVFLTGQSWI